MHSLPKSPVPRSDSYSHGTAVTRPALGVVPLPTTSNGVLITSRPASHATRKPHFQVCFLRPLPVLTVFNGNSEGDISIKENRVAQRAGLSCGAVIIEASAKLAGALGRRGPGTAVSNQRISYTPTRKALSLSPVYR